MKDTLCPFAKPIIGNWCQCQQANMDERCAGKMVCKQPEKYLSHCRELVNLFKEKSRFVLGIGPLQNELTHMQLMKIRCGGLLGMHRLLTGNQKSIPNVLQTMKLAQNTYGHVSSFPFSEIVKDINDFNHRKNRFKRTKNSE